MTKIERLLEVLSKSVAEGGGVLTGYELAYMMGEAYTSVFTKFLTIGVKKGLLRRVAQGVFESTITPPDATTAIYKIAKKLRKNVLTYISLESQLSYTGHISQIVMGRITLMTKGRKGLFETPYGTIEFIHTAQSVDELMDNLYFDSDIKMYRAHTELALSDLKNCKRNLHLLEN